MTVAVSDAELVRRVGAGADAEAESELCRRMGPRIRLYGLRHLRDGYAADDLVQQVLVTTLQALRAGRLREPEKLASYVLGTCRMTVLELRRGTRRRERLMADFAAEFTTAHTAAVRWDSGRLSRCVQALPERERSVIVMSFYDERTSADLAGFLGTSEGNVRVIRHRALRQLRTCMSAGA